jgi:hypothetical protein
MLQIGINPVAFGFAASEFNRPRCEKTGQIFVRQLSEWMKEIEGDLNSSGGARRVPLLDQSLLTKILVLQCRSLSVTYKATLAEEILVRSPLLREQTTI